MRICSAVVDLTPKDPAPMGGHDGTDRLALRTHGSLEANILMVGDEPSAVAIVSIDTLFAGRDLTQAITDAFAVHYGLKAEQVLVLASHTHSAPMLDRSKPRIGALARAELARSIEAIGLAIGRLRPQMASHVATGLGASDSSVNRRLRWRIPSLARLVGRLDSDIYMCDNPAGPRDPTIRTAIWYAGDRPIAALWSFACHPVGFPEPATASADFVGVVRQRLRAQHGADLPVLFAPGCMGDVRPRSPGGRTTLQSLVRLAIYGPSTPVFSRDSWDEWASGLASEVAAVTLLAQRRPIEEEPSSSMMVRVPVSELFEGESAVSELCLKRVRIPGIGNILTLSCEPVTAIGALLRRDADDLILGYEGDVFGYLPNEAMIPEGGYEVSRFKSYFGLRGEWRAGLDGRLLKFTRPLRH